jgi:hypothetical protein
MTASAALSMFISLHETPPLARRPAPLRFSAAIVVGLFEH